MHNMFANILIIWGLAAFKTVIADGRTFLQRITYSPLNAVCVEYMIPVVLSTLVMQFNGPHWNNDYDLVDYVTLSTSRKNAGLLPQPLTGPFQFHGNFSILGTFCSPRQVEWNGAVLLATHGLGYNREYWNSQFAPERYSFVQSAMQSGYGVLFYDRLGVGKSSKLSGWVNQASIQTEILLDIARSVKGGKFTNELGPPKKLVLLGHSFGSYLSAAVLARDPGVADAAVLTGFSPRVDGLVATEAVNLRIAKSQNQANWGHLDGYLTWSDVFVNIHNYFKTGNYFAATAHHTEVTKEPFAILEPLTLRYLNVNPTNYQGSVLVFNGEYDFLICGGYCPGIFESRVRAAFRSARNVMTYVQPDTGHLLNYHENATDGWWVMMSWMKSIGIESEKKYIHY